MDSTAGGFDEAQLVLHAAWMRRLAGSLVGEAAAADDVAQEAALAALRHPPHHGLNLRSWFSQVVRSSASSFGRAEGRRVEREARAARPEALPSAGELAAEAEIQHELSEALLALKEPYRSTLILRFYHDLEPAEIAQRSGEKAGTVRSRLSRGLELLRERLDARCGGRKAWSAVLAPLATWEIAGRSGAAVTAGVSGGLALGIMAALAAVVAAGLYINFNGSKERLEGEPAERAPETAGAVPPARAARGEGPLAPPAAGGERVALAATPAAREPWGVRVVARDPDGEPVAGVSVKLFPYAENKPLLATAETDEHGSARLVPQDGSLPGARLAWEDAGGNKGHSDFDDLAGELELRIRWTATLTGVVRGAETGEPLEGVEVLDGPRSALTGPDGRYRLSDLPLGEIAVWFHKDGYADGSLTPYLSEPGETQGDLTLEPGFAIELAFFDRDTGSPIPEVAVERGHFFGGQPSAVAGEGGTLGLRAAVGSLLSLSAAAEGYSKCIWEWDVQAKPAQAVIRVPLIREAWIEGRVTDDAGHAVEGAFLSAECAEHGAVLYLTAEQRAELGLPGSCGYFAILPFPGMNVRSDASGNYRLPVVGCGHTWRLRAGQGPFAVARSTVEPLGPGESAREDIQLARAATIRGRVLENGKPLAGAHVIWNSGPESERNTALCAADGGYKLAQVAPGEVTLALFDRGAAEPLEIVRVQVSPGQILDQDFVRTLELAEITGRVSIAQRTPAAGALVKASLLSPEGAVKRTFQTFTDAEGHYVLPVASGSLYELLASLDGMSGPRSRVPAGATDVNLDLPAPGTLHLRFVEAQTGAPVRPAPGVAKLYVRRAGGEFERRTAGSADADGRQELTIEAGVVDVLVHLAKEGYAPRLVEGLRASPDGASETVTVELERGLEAHLFFVGEDVSPLQMGQHVLFLVEKAQFGQIEGPLDERGGPPLYAIGAVWMRLSTPALLGQVVRIGTDGGARVPGLAPGRYQLRVHPDDFVFEPAFIDLPAPSAEPVEVRWRRR